MAAAGRDAMSAEFPLRSDGYLRTGIRNLEAAKRHLRRKFSQGVPEPIASRPGARFYITARSGRRAAFLLGPYSSHVIALTHVERGRRLAYECDRDTVFYAHGTASSPVTRETVFGR
jgi:hypothetical protein